MRESRRTKVGEMLVEHLRAKGLTQAKLARHVGSTPPVISRLFYNPQPDRDLLKAILKLEELDLSTDDQAAISRLADEGGPQVGRPRRPRESTASVVPREWEEGWLAQWVGNHVAPRMRDEFELCVFTQTPDILLTLLPHLPPNLSVRILSGDWLAEPSGVREGAPRPASSVEDRASPGDRRARAVVKDAARFLDESIRERHLRDRVEMRFVQSAPLLWGPVLSNESGEGLWGEISLYLPSNAQGEALTFTEQPFVAISLGGEGGPQTEVLRTALSYFNVLWRDARTIVDLEGEEERAREREAGRQVWATGDGLPYIIVARGFSHPKRGPSYFCAEDQNAVQPIKDVLRCYGAEVKVLVLVCPTADDWERADEEQRNSWKREQADGITEVKAWKGHVVVLCRHVADILKFVDPILDGLPYLVEEPESDRPCLVDVEHEHHGFNSPLDANPHRDADYCVIVKRDRRRGEGKLFASIGLHAKGTWAGAELLGQHPSLAMLAQVVQSGNFAAVVEGKFDRAGTAPPRLMNARVHLGPVPLGPFEPVA